MSVPARPIRIAVICPNNAEDMELIVPVDIWRRAKFTVDVIIYDTKANVHLAYSGLKLFSDYSIKATNLAQYDAIYLPGGPGWKNYLASNAIEKVEGESRLHQFLKRFFDDDKKWLAALCGAPIALLSVLEESRTKDLKFTCYDDPAAYGDFQRNRLNKKIVVDQMVVTGQNAGCSMDIALSMVELLGGMELAQTISKKLFVDYPGANNYPELNQA